MTGSSSAGLDGVNEQTFVLAARTIETDDIVRRASIAAAAGYAGLGLKYDQYLAARADGFSDTDLRNLLVDNGLRVIEVQSVQGWAGSVQQRANARLLAVECLRIAEAVGAEYLSVNATDLVGDLDSAAAGFADIAVMAADFGVLAALEYLPWGPVRSARTAWDVIQRSGSDNGAVLVDAWHHFKGACGDDDLLGVPANRIAGIQFSDGTSDIRQSLPDDSKNERLYPGDGSFDLAQFVRVLDGMGVSTPYSIEVLSTACRESPPARVARDAMMAARVVLETARTVTLS